MFHEDKKNITNILKPNNFGYLIGKVINKTKEGYQLELTEPLNQNDGIRIDHNGEDINLTATRLYNNKGEFISSASSTCFIKIKEELQKGDPVYKTKDISSLYDYELLPSYDAMTAEKIQYAKSFKIQYDNTDPFNGKTLVEPYPNGVYVVQNIPQKEATQQMQ